MTSYAMKPALRAVTTRDGPVDHLLLAAHRTLIVARAVRTASRLANCTRIYKKEICRRRGPV